MRAWASRVSSSMSAQRPPSERLSSAADVFRTAMGSRSGRLWRPCGKASGIEDDDDLAAARAKLGAAWGRGTRKSSSGSPPPSASRSGNTRSLTCSGRRASSWRRSRRRRPLVLVFEDVHWAEPALLDLDRPRCIDGGGSAGAPPLRCTAGSPREAPGLGAARAPRTRAAFSGRERADHRQLPRRGRHRRGGARANRRGSGGKPAVRRAAALDDDRRRTPPRRGRRLANR